jgi:hypothetical protein
MQKMMQLLVDIGLPKGVVNVVHGERETVEAWYDDDNVSGVCLVGSTPTAPPLPQAAALTARRPCCSAAPRTSCSQWKTRRWISHRERADVGLRLGRPALPGGVVTLLPFQKSTTNSLNVLWPHRRASA